MKRSPVGKDWTAKLDIAIERLELFLDPTSQRLLRELEQARPPHLSDLSQRLGKSPSSIKRHLDKLKSAEFVYHPQRLPKAYTADAIKCLRIRWSAQRLAQAYEVE